MNRDSMKLLYESGGEDKATREKRFAKSMITLINEGKVPVESFSIKALWQAMGEPKLRESSVIDEVAVDDIQFTEGLTPSAFPKITGALINKVVQEAYDLEYGVGDQLVTVIPSSVNDETIVGFGEDMQMKEVPAGIEYEEGSITEKYHKIKNTKKGRIISLTEEMVKFDQTGQMVMRARRVGEAAKSDREKTILNAVLGVTNTGLLAAWRPAGTAATLYSNTSTDPYTTATQDNLGAEALVDETDLDTAMALFGAMTDEYGLPMLINPKILFVPLALKGAGYKICYSGQSVKASNPAGVKNIYSDMGVTCLSSSFIDQLVSTTAWYFGDFKRQFVYTEVFPLQVLQAKAGNDQEFERDIIFRFKARYMGGCGAVSNRYVVKGNA
jgi:hypothetical protein